MERKGHSYDDTDDAKGSADAKHQMAEGKESDKQIENRLEELRLDEETEEEFERLKAAPKTLIVEKSSNPRSLKIVDGFKMYVHI